MKPNQNKISSLFTAMLMGATPLVPVDIARSQDTGDPPGAEVLTRGPVHEAFAGTVSFNPEVGIIVNQAPPAMIEEIAPEQRLEGDNVAWIPGYWAWDEEGSDFIWISGIWRNLPPGREWIPGYWAETEGGHQWTSGYWEDAESTEVTYLPEPPKSVESGPSVAASSDSESWVPGNWRWRDERYVWSAGYYAPRRDDWSWTPSNYRWTQRGYVYVDGYWDYPVVRRGTVFAPVRFQREYYSRPDYYYTPSTVISLAVFTNHLFVRPSYGHYYYGDYYEPRYQQNGFFASFSYSSSRHGYDPIYSYDRWEHRDDRDWERGRRDYYEYRRENRDARPPRSWSELSAMSQEKRQRGDYGVAERFDQVTSNRRDGGQRFRKMEKEERDQIVAQKSKIKDFRQERERIEKRDEKSASKDGKRKRTEASSEKTTRSPVMAKKSDRDGSMPERLQPRRNEKNGDRKEAKSAEGERSNGERKEGKNAEGDRSNG